MYVELRENHLSTTYAINTSVQTTTKCQPFLLMFYRKPLGATALNSQYENDDTDPAYDTLASGITAEDVHNNLQANISKVIVVNLQVSISRCICIPDSCIIQWLVHVYYETCIHLAVDKVIAKIIRLTFLAHPVCHKSYLLHSHSSTAECIATC